MESLTAALAKFGLNLAHALVGALGALISLTLFAFPEAIKSSYFKRTMIVVAGFCLSGFGTETVVDWFSLKPSAAGISGFLLGMFGMSFAMKVYEALQASNFADIIRNRFGGKP